ncbi:MAG: cyclase family protein [Flavobacteriales bacterium]
MKTITVHHRESKYEAKLNEGIDLSIPLETGEGKVSAWYVPPVTIEPVRTAQFVGSVKEGGSVNFRNVFFNPHGHGTHTECLGHITANVYSVNKHITDYHCFAELVSVTPEECKSKFDETSTDHVVGLKPFLSVLNSPPEALIIRTLPNTKGKKSLNYSATNPPYLSLELIEAIHDAGIKHLLIDLPSVDREEDGGRLEGHHAFWDVGGSEKKDRSITELIFVSNEVVDGSYYLNLQIAPFENDASPSRPMIYPLRLL